MTTRVSAGGPPDRLTATLTIHGDDLDPARIAATLRCPPDEAHIKGEAGSRGVPQRTGAWLVKAASDGREPPAVVIGALLDRVPVDAQAWEEVRSANEVSLDLCVTMTSENRDLVLPPQLVASLATIGAGIWVDIYALDEE